jgi:hypothetical protein
MSDDIENVARSVINAAVGGDMTAARIILDRVCPARRDRPISIDITNVATASDSLTAGRLRSAAPSPGGPP